MKNKIKTLVLVAAMTAGMSLALPTETHAQSLCANMGETLA